MSQDEYIFEDPKNQMSAHGFHNFLLSFMKNIQNKVLLISLKSLTNCKNPSCNPLQEAFSRFLKAACDCKSGSKSRVWHWNCPERRLEMLSWEFPPIRLKENWFDAAYVTISGISECFQRASINFLFIFSLYQGIQANSFITINVPIL